MIQKLLELTLAISAIGAASSLAVVACWTESVVSDAIRLYRKTKKQSKHRYKKVIIRASLVGAVCCWICYRVFIVCWEISNNTDIATSLEARDVSIGKIVIITISIILSTIIGWVFHKLYTDDLIAMNKIFKISKIGR